MDEDTTSLFAKIYKKWDQLLFFSKLLLFVAFLEMLIMIVIGILTICLPRNNCFKSDGVTTIPCKESFLVNQAILMFVWAVFFGMSMLDGLFIGNIYELYSAMFLACFVTGWSIWRFIQPYTNNYLDFIFIIVSCSSQIIYFALSPKLYHEYRWVMYKQVGADKMTRALYKRYIILLSFLKEDTIFSIFSVILSGDGVYNVGWMAGLDYTAFFFCIIFLAAGWYIFKNEIVVWTRIWLCFFPLVPAYVIGFGVVIIQSMASDDFGSRVLGILYLICGSCSLICRIILLYLSIIVYNNFGKGLLQAQNSKIEKSKSNILEEEISDIEDHAESTNNSPNNNNNYNNNDDIGTAAGTPEEGTGWTMKDIMDNIEKRDTQDSLRKY